MYCNNLAREGRGNANFDGESHFVRLPGFGLDLVVLRSATPHRSVHLSALVAPEFPVVRRPDWGPLPAAISVEAAASLLRCTALAERTVRPSRQVS